MLVWFLQGWYVQTPCPARKAELSLYNCYILTWILFLYTEGLWCPGAIPQEPLPLSRPEWLFCAVCVGHHCHCVEDSCKWSSIPRVPGFEVNWQKTKVQALGCREDMPLTIEVQGQDVMVVEEFVYLGCLIHSSTGSTCDISCRSAITRAAMQSLENQIWRSRLAIST